MLVERREQRMTVKHGVLNRTPEKCDETARLSSSLDTTGRASFVCPRVNGGEKTWLAYFIEASNAVD